MDAFDVRSVELQALGTVAWVLLLAWLMRSRPPERLADGAYQLSYPLGVRGLGIGGALLLGASGVFGLTSGQQWAGVFCCVFVIPFVFLWVESLTVFVVDSEKITRIERFRRPSTLRWDQVTSIEVGGHRDNASRELILRSRVRGGLHLSGTLTGRVVVARILLDKISKEALGESREAEAYLEHVLAEDEVQSRSGV